MIGILKGKLRLLIKNPGPFIITTVMCIAFAFFTGITSFTKIEIPVHSTLQEDELNIILDELNESEAYEFVVEEEEKVKQSVAVGDAVAGIMLNKDSYIIYQSSNNHNFPVIHQYISRYYEKKYKLEEVKQLAGGSSEVIKKIEKVDSNPTFSIQVSSYKDEEKWVYDQSLQGLFGFALFFSIYTVAFNVVEILKEKQSGIWDRLILSPTSKTSMYVGNLLYSFLIGYIQIALIFVVFKYGAGVNFYGSFLQTLLLIIPYLFSIVALSILLTGLVKTVSQFNALIPLIGVSFAMLGGAYWPIELVSSNTLLAISKFVPITYGMEILKGATISNLSLTDLLYPISILILMGVVMMGVGIRLMERRHV